MKITVLVDNHTYIDAYYLGEPSFSCFVEADGKTLLFDTGYSDVFARNAEKMGLNWRDVDAVVLSHGHNDHTGGLEAFLRTPSNKRPALIAHPDAFIRRLDGGLDVGSPVSAETVSGCMNVQLSKQPVWITERLVFLGEIPELFEKRVAVGELPSGESDFVKDDSALAYVGNDGVYIITGCSHSGICNIAAYAKQVTGRDTIAGIIGGFHLFENDAHSQHATEFLSKENIPQLWPCHCTSFCVRAHMSRHMDVREVGVGLTLQWD